MTEPYLIQKRDELEDAIDVLYDADVIGVDTEFIRETTFYPRIALIQAATDRETFLIDPLAFEPEELDSFMALMRDKRILKIMHAAFADQECLFWAYGDVAEPVLDTAVAAALVGLGDNVGLGKLLKEVCRLNVPKGRARVKWLARPLSRELLQYAEQDVAHLVKLGRALMDRLRAKGRLEWAMDESIILPSVFDTPPEELAMRMARSGQMDPQTYNVLVELLRWREDRAKQANLPRAWVAGNEVLVSLAKVRPTSLEDLRSFRGLNAKEIDRQGERILDAIRRGRGAPRDNVRLPERGPSPTENEDHVLDLIKTYVAYLAAHHEVAPRYLINTGKAFPLLQMSDCDDTEWVKAGILSEPSRRLVGAELKALLQGRRALVLKGRRVEIREL